MPMWMLCLVPKISCGRWVSAAGVFLLMSGTLASVGSFLDEGGAFIGYVPLFFCVIVAYIIPVFHFITIRTQEAFDDLVPALELKGEQCARLRTGITEKSMGWITINLVLAVACWGLQSWILAGSEGMLEGFTSGIGNLVRALAPLAVWITMTCAIHALIDNALVFRKLAQQVRIDVLNVRALTPFGQMAVSSILLVVGSQASFSIMWLGGFTDPWTTIPGLIPTTAALLFLFFAPIWPLHDALKKAKSAELEELQQKINLARTGNAEYSIELVTLLAVRRELLSTPEWPFDLGLVTRLGLYLVIVPFTWIGAALIENLVDIFVSR